MKRILLALSFLTVAASAALAGPPAIPPSAPPPRATCSAGTFVSALNGGSAPTCTSPSGAGLGDVTGPASSTTGDLAIFNGATGKVISDSAIAAGDLVTVNSASGVTAGDYGDATHCAQFTVAANGTLTAASQSTSCPGGAGGAVTSVSGTGNIVCDPTTGDVVCDSTSLISAQTGTSYTMLSSDMGKLVTFSNASSIAVTLPQAGTTGFEYGKAFDVQNKGAGTATITPTTSTINGAASLAIPQNRGCSIYSDGTNYQISACTALIGDLTLNAQTGTTYTILSSDIRKLITFSNTAAVAVTVPQAGTTGFETGKYFDVQNLNYGLVTLTPTTSTVNGNTTLNVPRNTGCRLVSDGTNWQIFSCTAVGRMDVAVNFSGVPNNSQKFTFIADRSFNLPASLTNSRATIGTNPTSTLTVTLNKNGSSIGSIAFNTSGTPTFTFASAVTFAAGDILTAVCPGTADATGADIAFTLWGSLN